MLSLNKQEKDVFYKLSSGEDGKILREYIGKVIDEVSNVDNLTSDIIKNAQNVRSILKSQLQEHLVRTEVDLNEEDTYE